MNASSQEYQACAGCRLFDQRDARSCFGQCTFFTRLKRYPFYVKPVTVHRRDGGHCMAFERSTVTSAGTTLNTKEVHA